MPTISGARSFAFCLAQNGCPASESKFLRYLMPHGVWLATKKGGFLLVFSSKNHLWHKCTRKDHGEGNGKNGAVTKDLPSKIVWRAFCPLVKKNVYTSDLNTPRARRGLLTLQYNRPMEGQNCKDIRTFLDKWTENRKKWESLSVPESGLDGMGKKGHVCCAYHRRLVMITTPAH